MYGREVWVIMEPLRREHGRPVIMAACASLLIFCNAVFSGAEIAVITMNDLRMEKLAEEETGRPSG